MLHSSNKPSADPAVSTLNISTKLTGIIMLLPSSPSHDSRKLPFPNTCTTSGTLLLKITSTTQTNPLHATTTITLLMLAHYALSNVSSPRHIMSNQKLGGTTSSMVNLASVGTQSSSLSTKVASHAIPHHKLQKLSL